MDQFCGRREGSCSPEGSSMAKGIGSMEEMAASRSRGSPAGPSSQGGCTRRRGTWGGVETVRGWLEWAVCGGSVRSERKGGRGAEEQSRAPARRSGELLASVRRSGW
jgi:hypothetical protein